MNDNIVDISEVRKQKEQKKLGPLPQVATDYIEIRKLQKQRILEINETVKIFEEHLTLSKDKEFTGPQIDDYVNSKIAVQIAEETIKVNDDLMRQSYPGIELSE